MFPTPPRPNTGGWIERPPEPTPSVADVFGPDDPWIPDPTITHLPTGTVSHCNPRYFATEAAAKKVQSMIGGKLYEDLITRFGPYAQSDKNWMLQFPNGAFVNCGMFIDHWAHGWTQSYIDTLVASDLRG